LRTFLAIKRCQRTKIQKVIKLARSSKKKSGRRYATTAVKLGAFLKTQRHKNIGHRHKFMSFNPIFNPIICMLVIKTQICRTSPPRSANLCPDIPLTYILISPLNVPSLTARRRRTPPPPPPLSPLPSIDHAAVHRAAVVHLVAPLIRRCPIALPPSITIVPPPSIVIAAAVHLAPPPIAPLPRRRWRRHGC
jgi:hypothetical protein